jgi:hypothetical protein
LRTADTVSLPPTVSGDRNATTTPFVSVSTVVFPRTVCASRRVVVRVGSRVTTVTLPTYDFPGGTLNRTAPAVQFTWIAGEAPTEETFRLVSSRGRQSAMARSTPDASFEGRTTKTPTKPGFVMFRVVLPVRGPFVVRVVLLVVGVTSATVIIR